MSLELGQRLGLVGDAIGLAAQAVGECVAALDALFVGGRECPVRGKLDEERSMVLARGLFVEPGGLDQSPAMVTPLPRTREHFLGGHVLLELERLQPGLELTDRVVLHGHPLGE